MKKQVAFIIFFLLGSPAVSSAFSFSDVFGKKEYRYVKSKSLNVRADADAKSKLVGKLKYLQKVQVVKSVKNDKWWKISSPMKGYVSAAYLITEEQKNKLKKESESLVEDNRYMYVKSKTLNVRQKPAAKSTKVGTLINKQEVQVTHRTRDGKWFKISDPFQGFVFATYLTTEGPSESNLVFIAGIGAGAVMPEDYAFTGVSASSAFIDCHFSKSPWLGFRIGAGSVESFYEPESTLLSGGGDDNNFQMSSTINYLAYKPTYWVELGSNWFEHSNIYLLLGASQIASIIKNEKYDFQSEESGSGVLAGGGISTNLSLFRLGLQFLYFSRTGEFEQLEEISTGSNQLLLTMGVQF